MERFERQVDPDGVLSAQERARRAGAAMRAYFTALALRSSRARAKAAMVKRAVGSAAERCPHPQRLPGGGERR
jgi:hypothetical protein